MMTTDLHKVLRENNITIGQDTSIVFTDSSWNDCANTSRSAGGM